MLTAGEVRVAARHTLDGRPELARGGEGRRLRAVRRPGQQGPGRRRRRRLAEPDGAVPARRPAARPAPAPRAGPDARDGRPPRPREAPPGRHDRRRRLRDRRRGHGPGHPPHPRRDDLGPARRRRRAGRPVAAGRASSAAGSPTARPRARPPPRSATRRRSWPTRPSPRVAAWRAGRRGVRPPAPGGLAPRAGPLRPRPDPRAVRQRVQHAGAEPLPHRDQVPPRRRVLRRAHRRRRDAAPARPGVDRPAHGVRLSRREPAGSWPGSSGSTSRARRSPTSTARRSTGCRPSPGRSCGT